MGCCSSTDKASNPVPAKSHPHLMERAQELESEEPNSKAPPMEEETVKEVLSVTPTPRPFFLKMEKEMGPQPSFPKVEEVSVEMKASINAAEEISEISEICSLSESVSTTTITERRDDEERSRDDGEVRQRVNRSPAKLPRKRAVSAEFVGRTERGGKSPARRFEPSPGRRNDKAVKPGPGRDVGQTTRQWISGNGSLRRDPGESSGRRSRSPATRTDSAGYRSTLGRSPSSRRTMRSPCRIPASAPENGRKPEESEEIWPANESLENPLVSLECFIFL